MSATGDIRATREHKILKKRSAQLSNNLKAKAGGGDYIKARLSRFPCESDASWSGTTSNPKETTWSENWFKGDSGGVTGRKERAFLINYAARIVEKINQYVFGQDVKREGIDEEFEKDATKTGLSINSFMSEVSGSYSAGQWAWIGVDRGALEVDPATGKPLAKSVAAREAEGDRIFWSLWNANEVVDWNFGADGKLKWLITQQAVYDNSDYNKIPVNKKVRTIWEPNKATRLFLNDDDCSKVDKSVPFTHSASVVPFVLLGVPSEQPWWYDDVERVQASLLNLESAHNENLIQAVFPQLVIPHGLMGEIMRLTELEGVEGYTKALEMIRGLAYPILEPNDASGLTRYLTPNSSDLKAIPDEIIRRRKELMDIVGLAMQNKETNQVSSASSKAWDNLDPSNTLRNRSLALEEAEEKAILISKEMDSSFKVYNPEYPRQFDIPDIERDMEALFQLNNMTLPKSAKREVMRAAIHILSTVKSIPTERMDAIMEDIDNMELTELVDIVKSLPGTAQG